MTEYKNSIYFPDSRFSISFLLEDTGEPVPGRSSRKLYTPSSETLTAHSEKFPSTIRSAFLSAAQEILPHVSADEFSQWLEMARELMLFSETDTTLVSAYLASCGSVLARTQFTYFKGWVEKGSEIAKTSYLTAVTYFSLSRSFIRSSNNIQLRKWGDWALYLQTRVEPEIPLGTAFLQHSIDCLQFMTFREFREYKELGYLFFRNDRQIGIRFFSQIPAGLGDLEITQRRVLYRLTKGLSRNNPDAAFAFFRRYSERLIGIVANERNRALDLLEHISGTDYERIASVFSDLTAALQDQPYPLQLLILEQCERTAKISAEAAELLIRNVEKILEAIPEHFLSLFVETGLLMMTSRALDIHSFFSLNCEASDREIVKWQSAARLEDHRTVLHLFAKALTGESLLLKTTDNRPDIGIPAERDLPSTDGKILYIPWVMAGADSEKLNFSRYKAAVAHLCASIEFNIFSSGLHEIRRDLESLSEPQLALDIFQTLEHGYLDFQISRVYPGLQQNLAHTAAIDLAGRRSPNQLPFKEALVEILLLHSLRIFSSAFDDFLTKASSSLASHALILGKALTGFYETASNIRTVFKKTLDLYSYISNPRPDTPDTAQSPYRKSSPLNFRGFFHPSSLTENLRIRSAADKGVHPTAAGPGEQSVAGNCGNDSSSDPLTIMKGRIAAGTGVFLESIGQMPLTHAGPAPIEISPPPSCDIPPGFFAKPENVSEKAYRYDEWDYHSRSYRKNWCRLFEKQTETGDLSTIDRILFSHRALIRKVQEEFGKIKPASLEKIPRVDSGDEIDLSAAIEMVTDKKSGNTPSDRIFTRKEKRQNRTSILFLVDMSASTGSPVSRHEQFPVPRDPFFSSTPHDSPADQKIIDVEKESLVVVLEAMETLPHSTAVYGFSGYGRQEVEFYAIKDFSESCTDAVKMRISGMSPKRSTRIGPAIRHSVSKLADEDSEQRLLILISDGFPQDVDYGEDRSSYEYGLHDTMMALMEARYSHIQTFCITVDREGNDYLKKMCEPDRYLVVDHIAELPEMLSKVLAYIIF